MKVEVWTDGSGTSSGPGGWAALLRIERGDEKHERELVGYVEEATNNTMELTAVIEGLNGLTRPCDVEVYTDSKYVMHGFHPCDGKPDGRVERWKRRGWRTQDKEDVKNRALWERLDDAVSRHRSVAWHHIHGHTGIEFNERVDVLAGLARKVAGGKAPLNDLLSP